MINCTLISQLFYKHVHILHKIINCTLYWVIFSHLIVDFWMVKKDIHVLRIKHQHFSTKIFSARHIVQIFQTFFVICEYCQNNTICSSYICKNIHDSIITLQHIQVLTTIHFSMHSPWNSWKQGRIFSLSFRV